MGIVLILAGGGVAVAVSYFNSEQRPIPIIFSKNALLLETWNANKKNNIESSSGRTIDKSQNNLTTSEAESYTLLRAVWMDDKATFDKSWQFTKNNLQRPDHLFSWKYGQLSKNNYGVLVSEGGQNTASDADEDIALSLLMAYSRWNDIKYLAAAQPIISSIWNEEVVVIKGLPVLTADNLERNSITNVVVNPSYFAPANYKIFAKIDPLHDWKGLVANSYSIINQLSDSTLGNSHSDGLPPDWIQINRNTGAIIPDTSSNLDTNFSYDAMRIPFRLALDYKWFNDPSDKATLSRFGFLEQFWQNTHVLNAAYAHDGSVLASYESPAIYGGVIGYFNVIHPGQAKQIYRAKLNTLYSPDQQSWKAPAPGYYEDNWAWFGIALTDNSLPNLTVSY